MFFRQMYDFNFGGSWGGFQPYRKERFSPVAGSHPPKGLGAEIVFHRLKLRFSKCFRIGYTLHAATK